MRYIWILLLLAACAKTCEEYNPDKCPDTCEICASAIHVSYGACHTNEFCEKVDKCSGRMAEDCPVDCAVCPPCEECSAISCQTKEYCESIGFSSDWYESVKPD